MIRHFCISLHLIILKHLKIELAESARFETSLGVTFMMKNRSHRSMFKNMRQELYHGLTLVFFTRFEVLSCININAMLLKPQACILAINKQ